MEDLHGKVAFITGGAGGIGLGMARVLAGAGMRIALADIRPDPLRQAARALGATGAQVLAVELDVTDRAAWAQAAERVARALGPVQVLCSNAGVNFIGATQEATFEDWDFCLGVNLGGAVNAVRTFAPRLMAHGGGGHIVITSSVSGLFTSGGSGCYVTSKYALVGLAESLRADLAPHGIGVSVLCPGPVKSDLFESSVAVRPSALAPTGSVSITGPGVQREDTPIFATAPDGEQIGREVLRAIRRNDLYVLTHPEIRPMLEARAAALIASLPVRTVDPRRIAAAGALLDDSLYRREADKPPPS